MINQHNEILRAKSRSIIEGVDYFDTYAPTPSTLSIQLLTGVAVRNSVKLKSP